MTRVKTGAKQPFAGRVLRILLIAIAVVLFLHLIMQFLNLVVYHGYNEQVFRLSNRFDLDDESSVPTWLSQFLLLTIAVAAGLAAWLQKRKQPRFIWSMVAVIALVSSIDEIATIHEHILWILHATFYGNTASTPLHNGWVLVAPFVLLVGGAVIFMLHKYLPRRTFWLLSIAGVVFVSGAMGVDIVTSSLHFSDFMSQGVLVAIEEGTELIGSALALYAIVDAIEREHKSLFRNIKGRLIAAKQTPKGQ